MCEAMEKLITEHEKKVQRETEENTILRLWSKGKSLADIIDATDWTGERINVFLRSRNLRPTQ
jgi:hypothetical protein